jgi:hypothetical protein
LSEPPGSEAAPAAAGALQEPPGSDSASAAATSGDTLRRLDEPQGETAHVAVPPAFYTGFWIVAALIALALAWYYWQFDAEQFEILRMLTPR